MSGVRTNRGPVFRPGATPAGVWCCGRPMIQGNTPADGPIHVCRHCGAVARVAAGPIVEIIRLGHPPRRQSRRHPKPHYTWDDAEREARAFALSLYPLLISTGT